MSDKDHTRPGDLPRRNFLQVVASAALGPALLGAPTSAFAEDVDYGSLSAGAQALNELYKTIVKQLHSKPGISIAEARDIYEHWGDVAAEPRGIDYIEMQVAGLSALSIVPHSADTNRVLFCTHGGGYRVCSPYSHRKMYGHIAKAIGCRALVVDYRRAPEFNFPAQVEDTTAAYRAVLDSGVNADAIAIAGDSAGGCLAVTTALSLRQAGLPMPVAIVAMSPAVDVHASGRSYVSNQGKDFLLDRNLFVDLWKAYLDKPDAVESPLATPLNSDLSGLPPLYIQVGDAEVLLDDSRTLAELASKAGVETKIDVFAGMQHVFTMAAGRAQEADDAIQRIARWIKPKLRLV